MPYAKGTKTTVISSRKEISQILVRYGASAPEFKETPDGIAVEFALSKRQMSVSLPLPTPQKYIRPGQRQTQDALAAAKRQCNREIMRRYRALALVLKAKLEAIASGISTAEQEFLSDLVLPSGQRAGDWIEPQLVRIYEESQLLPAIIK